MSDTLRIREVRQAKRLKAVELAEAAEISAPFLSQLERGLVDPSLETLRRISRALDVPLFSLFAEAKDEHTVSVIRSGQETTIRSPDGSLVYKRKSHTVADLEVLAVTMLPRSESRDALWSHEAEECIVVMSGDLVVETSAGVYALAPGDSCHYDSRLPHRFVNKSDQRVEFLISVTPPSY
ncbi:MAG: cupin domain-containing protein [Candidatus Leucobacter sulfamidivorax]|nr:cupin domain-containing protein [Candidatus Leucobacter sulfamidivorax]